MNINLTINEMVLRDLPHEMTREQLTEIADQIGLQLSGNESLKSAAIERINVGLKSAHSKTHGSWSSCVAQTVAHGIARRS